MGIAWLPFYGHYMTVLPPEVALHEANVDTHSDASPQEFKQMGKGHEELWGLWGNLSNGVLLFCFGNKVLL